MFRTCVRVSALLLSAQAFWCARAGNSPAEYEDAFLPSSDVDVARPAEFRCAVCDGATGASFSKEWADLLTRAYVARKLDGPDRRRALQSCRRTWSRFVSAKELPWYAAAKAELGAYATLLGLTLRQGRLAHWGTWQALAVGDTCVFHVRGTRLRDAFPLTHPLEFSNSPSLIGTPKESDRLIASSWQHRRGRWKADDSFILCTDALARRALAQQLAGRPQWEFLRDLGTSDSAPDFGAWLADVRRSGAMGNDDVTLLRVNVHG